MRRRIRSTVHREGVNNLGYADNQKESAKANFSPVMVSWLLDDYAATRTLDSGEKSTDGDFGLDASAELE